MTLFMPIERNDECLACHGYEDNPLRGVLKLSLSTTDGEAHEAEHKKDISVFPLAFPMIAGPGAITSVLLMSGNIAHATVLWYPVLILILVLAITLVCLVFAARLSRLLGQTGANVISRLLGLILAALAVQFVIDGIKQTF